jgi:hypothetical protein
MSRYGRSGHYAGNNEQAHPQEFFVTGNLHVFYLFMSQPAAIRTGQTITSANGMAR